MLARVTTVVLLTLVSCRQVARPTTNAASRPVLLPIELHDEIYLARMETQLTVTPDGLLRLRSVTNKRYGSGEHWTERVETRSRRLTASEISELAALFDGWSDLPTHSGQAVPDGPDISITYGPHTVHGGYGGPGRFDEIRARLDALAASARLETK